MKNPIARNEDHAHPFRGETVLFATMHGKEEILTSQLNEVGLTCLGTKINTDEFGTFTGEVERHGSVRETLRKKISAVSSNQTGRFVLASEGSFGPHPILGFVPTDLESLLLWDRKYDVEIYAEFLCLQPVNGEKLLGPSDDFRNALLQLGFPEHGVIVHPEGKLVPVFKGLHSELKVAQAMLDSFMVSKTAKVVIANDLRACHNPTRRNAISRAGLVLLDKLNSFCPGCAYPGFAIARGMPGLPCAACEEPSAASKELIWECAKCSHSERRARPDGKRTIDMSECEFCNS